MKKRFNRVNPFDQENVHSEEFAPSQKDLAHASSLEDRIARFQSHYLTRHQGVYDDDHFPNPNFAFWELQTLNEEVRKSIGSVDHDTLLRKLKRLSDLTVESYNDYLHDRVDRYGESASYIATQGGSRTIQERIRSIAREIQETFEEARDVIHRYSFSHDQQATLLADLAREEAHFEQYKREPRLRLFEKGAKKILHFIDEQWIHAAIPQRMKRISGSPSTEASIHEDLDTLQTLVEHMQDQEIKDMCHAEYNGLARDVDRIESKQRNEESAARLIARVQDVIEFPHEFSSEQIQELMDELVALKDHFLSKQDRDRIETAIHQLRFQTHVKIPHSEGSTSIAAPSCVENALAVLGVSSQASKEDARKAYRKLALHFHTDRGEKDMSKIVQINQAYELLRKLGKI